LGKLLETSSAACESTGCVGAKSSSFAAASAEMGLYPHCAGSADCPGAAEAL
jgi:hypothetical protein